MNIFSRIVKAYQIGSNVLKSNISAINYLPSSFKSVSYKNNYYSMYEECPAVGIGVLKKSQAISTGKIVAINDKEEKITNAAFLKDLKVIDNPNAYQNRSQFIKTIETFMNIYGVAYVYRIVPIGFKDVKSMVVIPNNAITVNYKIASYINQESIILSYQINLFGMSYNITGDDLNNMIPIYDVSIELNEVIKPKSRLDLVYKNIENIAFSIESRQTTIKNRGAEVLLSPERGDAAGILTSLHPTEVENLQKEYRKYGSLSNQWHTMITKIPMRATKLTRTPTELGLFDSENADYRAVALAMGIPAPLMALPDTSKYNTYLEAKKEFYDDCIIPESQSIAEGFDKIFDTKNKGYSFMFDFSHLSFMQEDKKIKADTYASMSNSIRANVEAGILTIEEAKEILKGYE